MFSVYVVVTVLTVLATASIAVADFLRADFVLANSAEVGVPPSGLPFLGLLKLLGAIGLSAGLAGFEPLGVLAAAGLTVFFAGAVTAHVRAAVFHNIAFPLGYLALSAGSLALVLAQ
jgi:hypothetical protein